MVAAKFVYVHLRHLVYFHACTLFLDSLENLVSYPSNAVIYYVNEIFSDSA